MNLPNIVFFGTPEYSLIILEKLLSSGYPICVVVTKPPQPVGREQNLTPTPVANWAGAHNISLITPGSRPDKPWLFADEEKTSREILDYKPELLLSADYTQKIPLQLVRQTKYGGLNIHPSLLPAYRGPAPIPWAIANGETETGVSIVTLSEKFDAGTIVAQEKTPILASDTTDTLLTKLFTKGADLFVEILPKYLMSPTTYNLKPTTRSSYFPRLTRNHGFIPWHLLQKALNGEDVGQNERPEYLKLVIGHWSLVIERMWRAFHPWPGLWTKVKLAANSLQPTAQEKRLKILRCHLTTNYQLPTANLILDEIQLEGKNPLTGRDVENWLKIFA